MKSITLTLIRKIRITGLEKKQVQEMAQIVQKSIQKMGIENTTPVEEKIDWTDKQWTLIVNCENKDLFRLSLQANLSDDALKKLYLGTKMPLGVVLDHEDIQN